MIANFRWPEPDGAPDRKVISDVKQYGCHVIKVLAEGDLPPFSFSIGLYLSFGQPEVVIIGLNNDTSHTIINDIAQRCRAGETFLAGSSTDQLLDSYDVHFVNVAPQFYRDYLGYALWFYGSLDGEFPAVQAVWPDRTGKFPWDTGFDPSLRNVQPLLSESG